MNHVTENESSKRTLFVARRTSAWTLATALALTACTRESPRREQTEPTSPSVAPSALLRVAVPPALLALTHPTPASTIGTFGQRDATGNIVEAHRPDGATFHAPETEFFQTPNPSLVPILYPLHWPAVFEQDSEHYWLLHTSGWCWAPKSAGPFHPIDRATIRGE